LVWKVKVSTVKRLRGGKEYVERRISVPVDFPDVEEVYLLTPEEFEKLSTASLSTGKAFTRSGGKDSDRIPLEEHITCTARRLTARAYYLECRDGRKAFVPEETLIRIVEQFKDSILIEKPFEQAQKSQTQS